MSCYNIGNNKKISNSPIAQLVEQMTVNHRVAGSSPARGAIGLIVQSGLGLRIVNPATWVQIPLRPPQIIIGKYEIR